MKYFELLELSTNKQIRNKKEEYIEGMNFRDLISQDFEEGETT